MSWLEQYRVLARYNQWMNRKVYAVAAQLEDSERKRDRRAFFKSIHGTLNHLMVGDCVWMGRFTRAPEARARDQAGEPILVTGLSQELFSDFAQLSRERERMDTLIIDYTLQLDEAKLLAELQYKTSAGVAQSGPLWWALGHFFNHQTHHRGQITTLFSQQQLDTGATDLVAMLREDANAR
jgi:uncharacterized damage-inducible protein DinB